MADLTATAQTDIAAPPSDVWHALTEPEVIAKYFFGTHVVTDWRPGSPIVWSGEYDGKAYEDKGEILDVQPPERLSMTHFSPMTGLPDMPENYHTVTYELQGRDDSTHVSVRQENNKDEGEVDRSQANWAAVLDGLKRVVEGT
jgi:uncharacterized protein YndB with AHSA1/START domain